MVEDVMLGVGIFVVLVVIAMIGRAVNFPHADIWS